MWDACSLSHSRQHPRLSWLPSILVFHPRGMPRAAPSQRAGVGGPLAAILQEQSQHRPALGRSEGAQPFLRARASVTACPGSSCQLLCLEVPRAQVTAAQHRSFNGEKTKEWKENSSCHVTESNCSSVFPLFVLEGNPCTAIYCYDSTAHAGAVWAPC